jgi:hypothetical protein
VEPGRNIQVLTDLANDAQAAMEKWGATSVAAACRWARQVMAGTGVATRKIRELVLAETRQGIRLARYVEIGHAAEALDVPGLCWGDIKDMFEVLEKAYAERGET